MKEEKECDFTLLEALFKAVPSGKCRISWDLKGVSHYEDIETEAKVNRE